MMYLWPSQTLADSSCRSLHPFSVTMPTDSNPSPTAAKVSVLLDSRAVPAIFPEGVPSTFRRGREGVVRASVKGMTDRLTAQVSCSCVPRGEGTRQCMQAVHPAPPLPSPPCGLCCCPAGSTAHPRPANVGQQGCVGRFAPTGGCEEEETGSASGGVWSRMHAQRQRRVRGRRDTPSLLLCRWPSNFSTASMLTQS